MAIPFKAQNSTYRCKPIHTGQVIHADTVKDLSIYAKKTNVSRHLYGQEALFDDSEVGNLYVEY